MLYVRAFPVVVSTALASCALGQISSVTQERYVQTQAMVSSGASDSDYDGATNFGPFNRVIASSATGAAGAGAQAGASQNSVLTSALISGAFGAHCGVQTGATFVVGEADAVSHMLYIFEFAAPTPVEFLAQGELAFVGQNPDGEPSDLYGVAGVRLLDANTADLIAGFQLGETGTDSASFNGVLPAGQYVILATARIHAYSADLLGPPARTGSGDAEVSFSLTVVPAPSAMAVLALGVLGASRRRRV